MAVRTAVDELRGAGTQPIFQPVKLKVLPAELIVSVRSAMPGNVHERSVLAVEHQVLVDLVGERDEVVLDAQACDRLELGDGEHLAGGVVRGVEEERAGCGR